MMRGLGYGWDHMSGWGWVGMTAMLILWFTIIALIIWIAASPRGPRRSVAEGPEIVQPDRSTTILRERLAAGEITPEEYERTRALLIDSRSSDG